VAGLVWGVGTPPVDRYHAGIDQHQAVEEARDLVLSAHAVRDRAALVVLEQRVVEPVIHVGRVVYRQVTAGWQSSLELGHDRLGGPVVILFRITDVAENAHKHDRDGTAEIQFFPRYAQERIRIVEIRVNVIGAACRGAFGAGVGLGLTLGLGLGLGLAEQRPGVREDKRIVVDIDDPGIWGDPLRDLMRIVVAGQPGTDVKELADPSLAGQVTNHPGDEMAGRASLVENAWIEVREQVTGLLVDRIVVRAAQPVIPDPRRYGHSGVDLNGHGESPGVRNVNRHSQPRPLVRCAHLGLTSQV
jgi:hypothetical protein